MRNGFFLLLAISLAVHAGCSDDESNDDGSTGDSGTGGTGSGDDGSGDDGASGDSGESGDGGGSTGDTGQSGTGDSSSSGDGGGTGSCGGETCEAGQVCVLLCCGGAPGCYPADANGECQPGDMPIDAADCMAGCDVDPCCQGSCEPPPPYCIDEGDLICGGEIGDQCSTPNGDCYGTKVGNELQCSCG